MLHFNLSLFLIERRKSPSDLSKILNIPLKSILDMKRRGTVKPRFIEQLELHFGDCSKYILMEKSLVS